MLGIVAFGLTAYTLLPVAALPTVDFPTIQVSAQLPGASPETMASSVATPLERRFGRIAGLAEMTSSSSLGGTSITLQFDLGKSIDVAAEDVQAAVEVGAAFNLSTGYFQFAIPVGTNAQRFYRLHLIQ